MSTIEFLVTMPGRTLRADVPNTYRYMQALNLDKTGPYVCCWNKSDRSDALAIALTVVQ